MKMNVPVCEAEECVKKVKGCDMGYLFENMEKMDIQEERRKTAGAYSKVWKSTVLLCQKFGVSKEDTLQELLDTYGLHREETQKQVTLCWQ